jgi:hypothetical protein
VGGTGRKNVASTLGDGGAVLDGGLTRLGAPPRRAADDKNSAARRGRSSVLFARDHRRKHRRDVSRLVSHDLERITVTDG